MNMATITTFHPAVNPEDRKLIGRVRRLAARHGLRLVKSRSRREFTLGGSWQLQSSNTVARHLELKDALAICSQLERVR
jgi:hypothetical protein